MRYLDRCFSVCLAQTRCSLSTAFLPLCFSVHPSLSPGQAVARGLLSQAVCLPVAALSSTCPALVPVPISSSPAPASCPCPYCICIGPQGICMTHRELVSSLIAFIVQIVVSGFNRHVIHIYSKNQRMCELELCEKA